MMKGYSRAFRIDAEEMARIMRRFERRGEPYPSLKALLRATNFTKPPQRGEDETPAEFSARCQRMEVEDLRTPLELRVVDTLIARGDYYLRDKYIDLVASR